MKKTPLEEWIKTKIGYNGISMTRQAIQQYQLHKLKETVCHAQKNSSFYQHSLGNINAEKFSDIGNIRELPFTTPDDLRKNPFSFLCVNPNRIARIVTLPTSGTTGKPKRLFFTENDQELTIDFFHYGMKTMVKPGDRVLILMPGKTPGSIGHLLCKALERFKVHGILHGPAHNPEQAVRRAAHENVQCLVGIPVQVHAMALYQQTRKIPLSLQSVLLSTDRIPFLIYWTLKKTWQCSIFNHYGMTEMGLGGGVECEASDGYHFREADLFIEIVDPETRNPLCDGESGEIVFTTLTRKGMPLIRYCTGDIGRFMPDPCPCGTVLKRMEATIERISGNIILSTGDTLTIKDLDEVLFPFCGMLDFTAEVWHKGSKDCLHVTCRMYNNSSNSCINRIHKALMTIPAVSIAQYKGKMKIYVSIVDHNASWHHSNGITKRTITDRRKTNLPAEKAITPA